MPMTRLAALCLICACAGEAEVQLFVGLVDPAGFPRRPAEVRAVRGEELLAAVPIEEDGSFLLPVSPGAATRFEIADASTELVARVGDLLASVALEVEVCAGEDVADLGLITWQADPSLCLPTEPCRRAASDYERCTGAEAPPFTPVPVRESEDVAKDPRCEDEVPDVTCDDACGSELGAVFECGVDEQGAPLDCEQPLAALERCFVRTGCLEAPDMCCGPEFEAYNAACFFANGEYQCAPESPVAKPSRVVATRYGCSE